MPVKLVDEQANALLVKIANNEVVEAADGDSAFGMLSNDELNLVLKAARTHPYSLDGLLPMALTCRRFRDAIQAFGPKQLETRLESVSTSLAMLQWASSVGCPYPYELDAPDLLAHAAKHGACDVATFALSRGCKWRRALSVAIEHGQIDFVKWARRQEPPAPWGPNPEGGQNALFAAACRGEIELMDWLYSEGCPLGDVLQAAAWAHGLGSIEMMEWAFARGAELPEDLVLHECNWTLLRWLVTEHGCKIDSDTFVQQASDEAADLGGLQWLYAHRDFELSDEVAGLLLKVAAGAKRPLAALEWVASLTDGHVMIDHEVLCVAVCRPDLPEEEALSLVQWCVQPGLESPHLQLSLKTMGNHMARRYSFEQDCEVTVLHCAIVSGHARVVEWLLDHGCQMTMRGHDMNGPHNSCAVAALHGHMNVLRLLVGRGCWLNEDVLPAAFSGLQPLLGTSIEQRGSWPACVKILDELKELGCLKGRAKRTCAAFDRAAEMALSPVVEALLTWLKDAEAPWGPSTCASAAFHGHLCTLTWLHEHGCRWDESTCMAACGRDVSRGLAGILAGNNLHILRYARANGCPCGVSTCARAAQQNHNGLVQLRWLIHQGVPWDCKTTVAAAVYGSLSTLKWAIANGCPWRPEQVPIQALKMNGFVGGVGNAVLMWGHANGLWQDFPVNQPNSPS